MLHIKCHRFYHWIACDCVSACCVPPILDGSLHLGQTSRDPKVASTGSFSECSHGGGVINNCVVTERTTRKALINRKVLGVTVC